MKLPSSLLRGQPKEINEVYQVRQMKIQFGRFRQSLPNVFALPFQQMSSAVGTEISGVLGLEALEQLVIVIDYRNGLINFVLEKK